MGILESVREIVHKSGRDTVTVLLSEVRVVVMRLIGILRMVDHHREAKRPR